MLTIVGTASEAINPGMGAVVINVYLSLYFCFIKTPSLSKFTLFTSP